MGWREDDGKTKGRCKEEHQESSRGGEEETDNRASAEKNAYSTRKRSGQGRQTRQIALEQTRRGLTIDWTKETVVSSRYERSNALDLEQGVFMKADPRSIARSLKRSADRSRRRKSNPFGSAMSM